MCGIICGVSKQPIFQYLLKGLQLLEYRGYDSAGIAFHSQKGLVVHKSLGKVENLVQSLDKIPHIKEEKIGIAHTRWATHGRVCLENAHPQCSSSDIAVVHNGIIENFQNLKSRIMSKGYKFNSQTDSEVIPHLIDIEMKQGHSFLQSCHNCVRILQGQFAFVAMHKNIKDTLIAVRQGSPLVLGLGQDQNFFASDVLALLPITDQFIYFTDGDLCQITSQSVQIYDKSLSRVQRTVQKLDSFREKVDRTGFRHFMQKEIFEQSHAINKTIHLGYSKFRENRNPFGDHASLVFSKVQHMTFVACGTSYHAGLIAARWIEDIVGITTSVEIGSEYHTKKTIVPEGALFIAISQSGETADTISAYNKALKQNYIDYLCICNVQTSYLARSSNLCFITPAGPEIGVASTKAFTTQLSALALLTVTLAIEQKTISRKETLDFYKDLLLLDSFVERANELDFAINTKAVSLFAKDQSCLFLGRGLHYPVIKEGALKLKEITYIHAEAYPAGELKHGPLALVDNNMTIVAIVADDHLVDKMESSLNEVLARGAKVLVFIDSKISLRLDYPVTTIEVPCHSSCFLSPVIFTIPLQLLAYHVAIRLGTDVDKPRNLAKSVTVE